MHQITDQREKQIRAECREAYRSMGHTGNPYTPGTIEALVFESEALKIRFQEVSK